MSGCPDQRGRAAVAAVAVLLALHGGGPLAEAGGARAAQEHHVHMSGTSFSPVDLDIQPGDTVAWHNHDAYTHAATDDGVAWTTGDVAGGATVTLTFDDAASYTYQCGYHVQLGMTGTLDVVAAGEAPTVALTSPGAGAVLAGTVSVEGTAADADGAVASVHVRIGGGPWQLAQGTTSWTYTWDTTAVADGDHTLEARATDDDGTTGLSGPRTVQVANPPTVAIASPAEGDRVAGTVTVRGTASDPGPGGAVQQVEVRVDGGAWEPADGTTDWTFVWDTRAVENGPRTLEARSSDGALHSAPAARGVVVDNQLPDLTVAAVEVQGGLTFQTLRATIRNEADSAAGAFDVRFEYQGAGAPRTIQTVSVAGLGSRAETTLSVQWNTLGKLGAFRVLATADPAGSVPERDEGNNQGEATACVPALAGATCLLPPVELL